MGKETAALKVIFEVVFIPGYIAVISRPQNQLLSQLPYTAKNLVKLKKLAMDLNKLAEK